MSEEYKSVSQLSKIQKLIRCYQMQPDENGSCNPVYLGDYPDVPLPINKILKYKNYVLHVVTYILTDEDINNHIYNIVGVNVFREKERDSICSLDLAKRPDNKGFQLLFSDHHTHQVKVVEELDKLPDKSEIIEYIITKSFESPVKEILVS